MKQKYFLLSVFVFAGIVLSNYASAFCPVCVVAIGAGLGLSRWLGVDDVVSSIWIGGLLVSLIFWTLDEMKKREWRFSLDEIVVSSAYYLLTFIPLYYYGIVGHPRNKIFGVDKIIFGTAIGTVMFLFASWLHNHLKKKNNGVSYFNYQKVVIPVSVLLAASLTMYVLLKTKIIYLV